MSIISQTFVLIKNDLVTKVFIDFVSKKRKVFLFFFNYLIYLLYIPTKVSPPSSPPRPFFLSPPNTPFHFRKGEGDVPRLSTSLQVKLQYYYVS